MSALLCRCGHLESDHGEILGCTANTMTRPEGGVDYGCECLLFERAETETETTESYPLSRGD